MLAIFTWLADWIVYTLMGFQEGTRLADSIHFFVEDTTKILVLLVVMIYLIALARASLDLEKVRHYIQHRHRMTGYFLGSRVLAPSPRSVPARVFRCSWALPVPVFRWA